MLPEEINNSSIHGCCAVSSGKWLPAFREDTYTDVKETLRFSEVSVKIYQLTQRKSLKELKLHKDCCKNQKPRVNTTVCPRADTLYFIKLLPPLLLFTFVIVKVKQARCGPEGSRRFSLPYFMTFDIRRWWGPQPHATAAFTPRKFSWYSFSLGAESIPGPWYGEKSIDTTRNRSRDRQNNSAAPEPLRQPRTHVCYGINLKSLNTSSYR